MLDDYLKNLNNSFKSVVLNLCEKNYNFKLFLINCSKINLNIFENSKVCNRSILIEKIKNFKEVIIKTFAMKTFKKYSSDENSIENIEKNLKKIKNKFFIIENILNFLNQYSEIEFYNLFKNADINLKINYSIKPLEVLEFDPNLFLTSDDLDSESEKNNTLIYRIKGKDKYIHEYSN